MLSILAQKNKKSTFFENYQEKATSGTAGENFGLLFFLSVGTIIFELLKKSNIEFINKKNKLWIS